MEECSRSSRSGRLLRDGWGVGGQMGYVHKGVTQGMCKLQETVKKSLLGLIMLYGRVFVSLPHPFSPSLLLSPVSLTTVPMETPVELQVWRGLGRLFDVP